jgi:hypothetical protein
MISHVVLLQPKASATADDVAHALVHVRELQNVIPGILHVEIGENLSLNHRGYTFGFIMQFGDPAELQTYAAHPAHQPVSLELQGMCESIIDFDLEAAS